MWPLVVARKMSIPILDEEDYSYEMNVIAFSLLPVWLGINITSMIENIQSSICLVAYFYLHCFWSD